MSTNKTARQEIIAHEIEVVRSQLIKIQLDITFYESLKAKVDSNEIVLEGSIYHTEQTTEVLKNLKDSEKVYLHKLNVLKGLRTAEYDKRLLKSSKKTMAMARAADTIEVEFEQN